MKRKPPSPIVKKKKQPPYKFIPTKRGKATRGTGPSTRRGIPTQKERDLHTMPNVREEILRAEQFVRNFVLDHPHASVDMIAREVEKKCTHALHKSAISRIKRDATAQIAAAQTSIGQGYSPTKLPSAKQPIIRKKGQPLELAPTRRKVATPFNPPRIHIPQSDTERDVTVDEALQRATHQAVHESELPQDTPPSAPPSPPTLAAVPPLSSEWPPPHDPRWDKDLKTKWLYDYVEKNPEHTLHQVTRVLKNLAGSSLFATDVAAALRLARQVAGIPMAPSRYKRLSPTKSPENIPSGAEVLSLEKEKSSKDNEARVKTMHQAAKELARHMKLCSMRSYVITIDPEGGVDFHAERIEISELGGKLDLDT